MFFFLQQISGRVSSQLDLSDIQSCRLRSLFDWHYAEHHDASVFPQVTCLILFFRVFFTLIHAKLASLHEGF